MISLFLFEDHGDMDIEITLLSRYVFEILTYGQVDGQTGEQYIACL